MWHVPLILLLTLHRSLSVQAGDSKAAGWPRRSFLAGAEEPPESLLGQVKAAIKALRKVSKQERVRQVY